MAAAAETEENEVRSSLNRSHLSNNRGLHGDVAKSASTDALHPKELEDEYPVKVRMPYTITKQREKWTEEEHEKYLEALKLYGRSWRQIQEHIGTKTAVQILAAMPRRFSQRDSSTVANLTMEPLKYAPLSSSSASNQGDGSPVSVLSALQSDAFGSSASNPYDGCGSPVLSDGENTDPASVAEQDADEENVLSQVTGGDKHQKELDLDGKGEDLSEEDSSEVVQNTSLKLFGKTVVIPDPRKTCSLVIEGENHEHSLQPSSEDLKALLTGDFAAMAPIG